MEKKSVSNIFSMVSALVSFPKYLPWVCALASRNDGLESLS